MNEDPLNDHESDDRTDQDGMANESTHDFEDSEVEEGPESIPFGMSGVTGLLQRLAVGIDEKEWSPRKKRAVARYLLDLSSEFWMKQDEVAFCRRVAAA
ncbi:MAG: hypothetical protein O3A19_09235 [Planctomycetota bacterium]|nr:hypothetical protein [Planctomycetota bacterium]